ncbi:MAG: hypothetical protein ABFD89_04790 [Bryobacteraceae bacterium]
MADETDDVVDDVIPLPGEETAEIEIDEPGENEPAEVEETETPAAEGAVVDEDAAQVAALEALKAANPRLYDITVKAMEAEAESAEKAAKDAEAPATTPGEDPELEAAGASAEVEHSLAQASREFSNKLTEYRGWIAERDALIARENALASERLEDPIAFDPVKYYEIRERRQQIQAEINQRHAVLVSGQTAIENVQRFSQEVDRYAPLKQYRADWCRERLKGNIPDGIPFRQQVEQFNAILVARGRKLGQTKGAVSAETDRVKKVLARLKGPALSKQGAAGAVRKEGVKQASSIPTKGMTPEQKAVAMRPWD